MDKRQQKTRAAIFAAFTKLLEKENYNKITVQEILDEANIGRSTFYAHFETKDYLLKELCRELFDHLTESAISMTPTPCLYAGDGGAPVSIYQHMLLHLRGNDRGILTLLSCESNEIFLYYFKESINSLLRNQMKKEGLHFASDLPENFLINHISASFVDLVEWWISEGMKSSPEALDRFFSSATRPLFVED